MVLTTLLLAIAPAKPAFALGATATVTSSESHNCVLELSGDAYCWGQNGYGKLGDGTGTPSNKSIPTLVAGGHTWSSITAGGTMTCALTTGGAAYCWGNGNNMGTGTTSGSDVPQAVTGGHTFSVISAGWEHTCGLESGAVYCWGDNTYGQLGNNSTTASLSPTLVSGGLTFASVDGGRYHTCGLTTGGAAYCWGRNNGGQLGDASTTDRLVPTAVAGGHTFTSIKAGEGSSCALTGGGVAWCWGRNNGHQLGTGVNDWTDSSTPVTPLGGVLFASIEVGSQFACGVSTTGDGYCWGSSLGFGLGTGNNIEGQPTILTGSYKWQRISAGSTFGCGVTDGGGVKCWGYGGDGEVGNNATATQAAPTVAWLFVGTGSVTITGIVDPSLTFTVAGRGTVCNGQSGTGFQTGSTSTAVSLGHLTSAAVAGAAQDLTLATNAANGFTVYIRTSGTTPNSFRTSGGSTVADVPGTNASPGAAPVAGTAGFGYTSSDASTAFTSNTWAKLTNTDSAVLIGTAGTTSKSRCVGYGVAIAATSTAGSYSSSVVYTAVPSF